MLSIIPFYNEKAVWMTVRVWRTYRTFWQSFIAALAPSMTILFGDFVAGNQAPTVAALVGVVAPALAAALTAITYNGEQ